ncbi:MAG: tRNA-guanine transglycosylase, partial [Bacteroidaceae bacterium]|nr:tRNA-guanine transglycosylase [Bacteroidaceae bacterium]
MTFKKFHTAKDSEARAGLIQTDHGPIETPIFMPVGTVGSVKGVHLHEIKEDIGAQIILGNTYHLYLRPGLDTLRKAGGLHKFNGFDRPMLTDSGGFQVFSLTGIRKLTAEGCEFRSHIDGTRGNGGTLFSFSIKSELLFVNSNFSVLLLVSSYKISFKT